jgi:hypothetical protein
MGHNIINVISHIFILLIIEGNFNNILEFKLAKEIDHGCS